MNKNIPIISRYILGLIFLVFGVAGLFNLIPPPPNMPEGLMTFMSGLMASKYFFPLLKLTESVCGLLLLINIAPALMLVILAPITLNIVCVHLFLTPGIENLVMPVFILILHLLTAKKYWPVYRPLFDRN